VIKGWRRITCRRLYRIATKSPSEVEVPIWNLKGLISSGTREAVRWEDIATGKHGGHRLGTHPRTEGGEARQTERLNMWLLEMDDEAGGDAGAISLSASGIETDVVNLGAESQVWEQTEIHPATNAIRKLVGRTAAGTDGDA
jgi:hypothetical protein